MNLARISSCSTAWITSAIVAVFWAGCGNDMCVSGSQHACFTLIDEQSCARAAGCQWGMTCGAIACRDAHDAAACGALPHCIYDERTHACGQKMPGPDCTNDAAMCGPSDRCNVAARCFGDAADCLDHKSRQQCYNDPLCQWITPPAF